MLTQEMHYQQVLAVQNIVAHQKRLSSVGYGILRGAAAECEPRVRPDLGLMAMSRDRLPADNRELLAQAMELTDNDVKVLAVYKDSPAERAGILEGDIIVDPRSPAVPRAGESDAQALLRLPGPLTIGIRRGDRDISVTIAPEKICSDLLRVDPSNDVNAFAQGRVIVVTRGMMRFASRDRDLALVVSHELAHNVLGHHPSESPRQGISKVIETLFSERGARSEGRDAPDHYQELELAADSVGLYFLAKAGYDTRDAASLWRAMAVEYPAYIRSTHTSRHPSTPERFLNMDRTHEEIDLKRRAGLPLRPSLPKLR